MTRFAWNLVGLVCVLGLAVPAAAQTDFIEFDSGPVRPIALSPDELESTWS